MIRVFVLSKAMAEGIGKFNHRALVISIGSPGSEKAKIKGDHVHFFQFHDIDTQLFLEDANLIMNPMSVEIAESIAEIAVNNRDKKAWIIHCEAGISRSPGVALGLSKFLKFDTDMEELERMFPCHNRHVRRLVENAMQKRIDELTEELDKQAGCGGEE